MEYVSPFDERTRDPVAFASRPRELRAKTVALLDISKARGDEFLDRVEQLLQAEGAQTLRTAKPAFSRPAPVETIEELARGADLVVEALAD